MTTLVTKGKRMQFLRTDDSSTQQFILAELKNLELDPDVVTEVDSTDLTVDLEDLQVQLDDALTVEIDPAVEVEVDDEELC